MTRLYDWPERLASTLERHNSEPFVWGESDCFTRVLDVIEALNGSAPYASERGKYNSMVGALRRIKANKLKDMEGLALSFADEIPPIMATRGDIGLMDSPDGLAFVTCDGLHWVGAAETLGQMRLPLSTPLTAFRVR